jgi:intracellular septation protein
MKDLMQSGRALASDMAATILFLVVLLVTKNLPLAVALGIALGVGQVGWSLARKKPIELMQWMGVGLVVVSGLATLITSDPRFVMLKPTAVYIVVGLVMLKPGWMLRYLPPIAIQTTPDLAVVFGYIWAGLMFVSAGVNLVLAANLEPATWAAVKSVYAIGSKLLLFFIQYGVMRFVGQRRARMALAAA